MEFSHVSVMLNECIEALAIQPEGIYVDGTAGGAGHSSEIAKRLTTGRLIAIDQDPDAIEVATSRLAPFPQAKVVQANFAELPTVLTELDIDGIDGLLLDLGVSSYQLDTAERGFSYQNEAKLDMRMSQSGTSAYDVVNGYKEADLSRILFEYGEERYARGIAAAIVRERAKAPIETTTQLVSVIKQGMPAKAMRDGNPARRTFQAIRIEVNRELEVLGLAIEECFDCLRPGGRMAIISFHSLEDRIVKKSFKAFTVGCTCPKDFPVCVCGGKPRGKLITRKAMEATEEEVKVNPRSRSAKLRVIEKL